MDAPMHVYGYAVDFKRISYGVVLISWISCGFSADVVILAPGRSYESSCEHAEGVFRTTGKKFEQL